MEKDEFREQLKEIRKEFADEIHKVRNKLQAVELKAELLEREARHMKESAEIIAKAAILQTQTVSDLNNSITAMLASNKTYSKVIGISVVVLPVLLEVIHRLK